jgi:Fusaric acid resistance protein-like
MDQKSLVFTLKGVLHELPFGPAPAYEIMFHENFKTSLMDAKTLFISARHRALDSVYNNRLWSRKRSPDVDASYEEVAASCGHFCSCLEDLAEDTIAYLEILEELKDCSDYQSRSWDWLRFKWKRAPSALHDEEEPLLASQSNELPKARASPRQFVETRDHKVLKYRHNTNWTYRLWRATSTLRRDDSKYAIKVGLGAVLYAMFSFIPATRPIYAHWRGEWGLVSYMLVCSMNLGASNTTGIERFIGTCFGAICAIVGWALSGGSPGALGVFGWLVSIVCFYIILGQGKGPMGRFILLTYNLSALYAYTLSIKDDDGDDDDEGGMLPETLEIVMHRVIAVFVGCVWGIIVTRIIWPISARKKVKDGTALLWLRMGLIWKRDPLQVLLDGPSRSSYMEIKESIQLQRFLTRLDSLRNSATHEFDLRGPFPDQTYRQILESTGRILGAFHAMHVVIAKDLKASNGEADLLKLTKAERDELSSRISHLFSGKYPAELQPY